MTYRKCSVKKTELRSGANDTKTNYRQSCNTITLAERECSSQVFKVKPGGNATVTVLTAQKGEHKENHGSGEITVTKLELNTMPQGATNNTSVMNCHYFLIAQFNLRKYVGNERVGRAQVLQFNKPNNNEQPNNSYNNNNFLLCHGTLEVVHTESDKPLLLRYHAT